jgi:hypothetical protein
LGASALARRRAASAGRARGLPAILLIASGLHAWGCAVEREQPAAPDTTPPAVAILAPKTGATVADSVTVTVTAADAAGVARVTLLVDQSPRATRYAPPWELAWDTSACEDSSRHVLQAEAVDPTGNLALSDSTLVWVRRNAPPCVEIVWPPDCLWLAADRAGPAWRCRAWDPDDGWLEADAVTWRLDGVTLGAGCLSLDPPPLAIGDHRLAVIARDGWGRCGRATHRLTVFAEPGRASPEAAWASFACALRAREPEAAAGCLARGFRVHPPRCDGANALVSAADAARALAAIVGDSLLALFVLECQPGPAEVFELRGERIAKIELRDFCLRATYGESAIAPARAPGSTAHSVEIRGSAARIYLREEVGESGGAGESWLLDAWWDLHGSTWSAGSGPSWTATLWEALSRADGQASGG